MKDNTPFDNAVDLLDADHKAVKKMFIDYDALCEDGAPAAARRALAEKICQALTVHTQIEEEIFYPAVREATEDDPLLDEALAEHAAGEGTHRPDPGHEGDLRQLRRHRAAARQADRRARAGGARADVPRGAAGAARPARAGRAALPTQEATEWQPRPSRRRRKHESARLQGSAQTSRSRTCPMRRSSARPTCWCGSRAPTSAAPTCTCTKAAPTCSPGASSATRTLASLSRSVRRRSRQGRRPGLPAVQRRLRLLRELREGTERLLPHLQPGHGRCAPTASPAWAPTAAARPSCCACRTATSTAWCCRAMPRRRKATT